MKHWQECLGKPPRKTDVESMSRIFFPVSLEVYLMEPHNLIHCRILDIVRVVTSCSLIVGDYPPSMSVLASVQNLQVLTSFEYQPCPNFHQVNRLKH